MPRSDSSFTWGVIELDDEDYSIDIVDRSAEDECDAGLSCDWPPRDLEVIQMMGSDGDGGGGSGDGSAADDGVEARLRLRGLGWFEKRVAAAVRLVGPERADRVEGWVRTITGLTDMDEREYKVVVELDGTVYSFKVMKAGDLGKRA